MDPNFYLYAWLMVDSAASFTPTTLQPIWPLARELYAADRDNINFAEVDHD